MRELPGSNFCAGGHCGECRREGVEGERLRASIAKMFSVSADWPACHAGHPMGYVPPTRVLVPLVVMPAEAIAERRAACAACAENVDGVCRVVATAHGEKRAKIEHGTRRAGLRCPLGKWEAWKAG